MPLSEKEIAHYVAARVLILKMLAAVYLDD